MNDFFLGLMILAGMLSFGFLFGGIMSFRDQSDSEENGIPVLRLIDVSVLFGVISTIHDVGKYWKTNKDGRLCIYMGITFLVIAVGFAVARTKL